MISFRDAGTPPTEAAPEWLERPENVGLKAYLTGVVRLKRQHGASTTLDEEARHFVQVNKLGIRHVPRMGPGEVHCLEQVGESLTRINQAAQTLPTHVEGTRQTRTSIQREVQTAKRSLNVMARLQKLQALDQSNTFKSSP